MALTFQIMPQRGLVYVRYTGHLLFKDTVAAVAQYAAHPDAHPGQKQLVDLAAVTGYQRDFTKLMQIQASKAEIFTGGRSETLIVYYAPTDLSLELARIVERSWTDAPGVVVSIQTTQEAALSILGQPETSFAALLKQQV
ncbi:hypothetical protein [Actibacterium ureilyticum]|uniref:hypothetical protein n=1 Tax=Actibacterium ureilyticum TaxID=1590614 RepID=UPI000BAB1D69|nr:hypothetical protein [Actibacterium ureilyticum]